jgi:hypothetical protein
MSYNSSFERCSGATSFLTLPIKKLIFVLFVLVIHWQETLVTVKKDVLSLFVNMNALLFFMQYGHASFSCVLQPETIP